MLFDLLGSIVLFIVLVFGVGWPIASLGGLRPAEKLVTTAAFSLLGIFLYGWVAYVFRLPQVFLWLLPFIAVGGLAIRWTALMAVLQDAEVRALVAAQALITLSCLGWLGLVSSYSGGGWAADWFEHWERTRFFVEHGPLDTKFVGAYLLPARPPLANVVTSVLVTLSRVDFAHFQLFTTLLASLVFLPAGLFVRRFFDSVGGEGDGQPAIAVLAVLFLVNPLFVQNAVFAWTKLPAAFFALAGLWFFLRSRDPDAPPAASVIFAVLIAAGIITHYSVGPYAVVLAGWWFVAGRRHWRTREWRWETLLMTLSGALVLGAWFGWSVSVYGTQPTFLSNTTVAMQNAQDGDLFTKIGMNIFDTVVPHFLREFDTSLIAQQNVWGRWRDWFFQSYQLNLLFAFGSLAWLAILRELLRARRDAPRTAWTFWKAFVGASIILGIAVNGGRDHWGLAHICLQAIVLLGLAFLASRWHARSRRWRYILIASATLDFILGIALHFAVQNYTLFRWLTGAPSTDVAIIGLSQAAIMNFAAKAVHRLAFFSDAFPLPPVLLLGLVVAALAVAVRRTGATHTPMPAKSSPAPVLAGRL